jgi:lipoprotein-anchoring transpeptidase ErfK/SrfK
LSVKADIYEANLNSLNMRYIRLFVIASVAALSACRGDGDANVQQIEAAELSGVGYQTLSDEEMERGRFNTDWRRVVQFDTIGFEDADSANPESWDDISPSTVNSGATHLPLHGDVSGPSVLSIQILLDRALFSPGIIDGRWGKNTEIALYWFQNREGLRATGRADQATFERLAVTAGEPRELVRTHRLSEDDVEGPFVDIPEDIYDKAELDCLCYESLAEKLGELFHTSPDLLRKLNPGIELSSLSAGQGIIVPNVRDAGAAPVGEVTRLVISAHGHYLHALNSSGRVLYHFPTTLGSSYDPSPDGTHTVRSITRDPWWHYQPAILEHVDNSEPDAKIPPGPNNAVGRVWMALSKPHYGIHGTSAPETIGYATSAGCIRLTNWDALFLADRIESGVVVEFSDRPARSESAARS